MTPLLVLLLVLCCAVSRGRGDDARTEPEKRRDELADSFFLRRMRKTPLDFAIWGAVNGALLTLSVTAWVYHANAVGAVAFGVVGLVSSLSLYFSARAEAD